MFGEPLVEPVKDSRPLSFFHHGAMDMLIRDMALTAVSLHSNTAQSAYFVVDAALPRLTEKCLLDRVLHATEADHMAFAVAVRKLLERTSGEAACALVYCVRCLGFLIIEHHRKHPVLCFPLLLFSLFEWLDQSVEELAIQLGVAGCSYGWYDGTTAR